MTLSATLETNLDRIGDYRGIVARLPSHTAIGGVHTFSIVWNPTREQYVGYAGALLEGPIDAWFSDDLHTWRPYESNPIRNRPGLRWPSVLHGDGTYFMAVRSERHTGNGATDRLFRGFLTRSPSSRPLFAADRIRRKFTPEAPTTISLYSSEDGLDFTFETRLVDRAQTGMPYNQNPFLFVDPETGRPGLVYHTAEEGRWEIRYRSAESIPALSEAPDTVLASSSALLAAPALFYHPAQSAYYLLVETFDSETENWLTEMYVLDDLPSRVEAADSLLLFENDEACPFPYVENDTLYLFIARRLRDGLFPYWSGTIHAVDL